MFYLKENFNLRNILLLSICVLCTICVALFCLSNSYADEETNDHSSEESALNVQNDNETVVPDNESSGNEDTNITEEITNPDNVEPLAEKTKENSTIENAENFLSETNTSNEEGTNLNELLSGKTGAVSIGPGTYYLSDNLTLNDSTYLSIYAQKGDYYFSLHNYSIDVYASAFIGVSSAGESINEISIKIFGDNGSPASINLHYNSWKSAVIKDYDGLTTSGITMENLKIKNCASSIKNSCSAFYDDGLGIPESGVFPTFNFINCDFSNLYYVFSSSSTGYKYTNFINCNFDFIKNQFFEIGYICNSQVKFDDCNFGDYSDANNSNLIYMYSRYNNDFQPSLDITYTDGAKCSLKFATCISLWASTGNLPIKVNIGENIKLDSTIDIYQYNGVFPELNIAGDYDVKISTNNLPSIGNDKKVLSFASSEEAARYLSYSNQYWTTVKQEGEVYYVYMCGPRCITQQPTSDNPQVKIHGPEPESCITDYQWCSVDCSKFSLDTTNSDSAFTYYRHDWNSTYSDNKWTSNKDTWWTTGESYCYILYAKAKSLKAGDVITIKPESDYFKLNDGGEFGMFDASVSWKWYDTTYDSVSNTAKFTVPKDGDWIITYYQYSITSEQTLENMPMSASVFRLNSSVDIQGQDMPTLKADKTGSYQCRVTWTDSQTNGLPYSALSDVVDITVPNAYKLSFKVDERSREGGTVDATELNVLESATYSIDGNKISVVDTDGKTSNITATPNTGYVFDKWSASPAQLNNGSITSNTTFTASFNKLYSVKCASDDNGKLEADLEESIAGNVVSLMATPNEGYELDSINAIDESGNVIEVSGNSFIMPESNVVAAASFKVIDVPVVPDPSDEVSQLAQSTSSTGDNTPLCLILFCGLLGAACACTIRRLD